MSTQVDTKNSPTPVCHPETGAIALVIETRSRDLGGFTVRRLLPAGERRMVGPFIFFDHLGPAVFEPGKGIDVHPHPHIGLATVTWLFEGEIMHRDSLGFVQLIQAGAVNLMTAGKGIVHSERSPEDRSGSRPLHGIQLWLALPQDKEEMDPAFDHYSVRDIPRVKVDGVDVSVVMGSAYGMSSPVRSHASTLYLELKLPAGSSVRLPEDYEEMAFYVAEGSVAVDAQSYGEGVMAVTCPGKTVGLMAESDSRVMVIGGEAVGERHIWWNLVSSSLDRIRQAGEDWKEGRFDEVAGDDEFIPLPDDVP